MDRKNRLRQIDADCANRTHGRLLQWCFFNTSHSGTSMASIPMLLVKLLNFSTFRKLQCVLNINAKVANGTLYFGMTEQDLYGA
jgi:hypothetical protein